MEKNPNLEEILGLLPVLPPLLSRGSLQEKVLAAAAAAASSSLGMEVQNALLQPRTIVRRCICCCGSLRFGRGRFKRV